MRTNEARALGAIVAMAELFRVEFSEAALELFLESIKDMTDDEVVAASAWCAANVTYMPTPAQLREHAGKRETSKQDLAIRAFEVAFKASVEHGAYMTMDFHDVTTARTIEMMGGWAAFCQPTQSPEWARNEFIRTYTALHGTHEVDGRSGRLPGLFQQQGARPEPVFIGHPKDAKLLPRATDEKSDREVSQHMLSEMRKRLRGRGGVA